jgi:hypothetical protein
MKNLFTISIFIATLISCQLETSQMLDNNFSINLIKKYIPEKTYQKSKTISYINSTKIIKDFEISYDQYNLTDLMGNKLKKDVYTLQEKDNSLYYISISAQPELHDNIVYERLYVDLLTSLNQGLTANIIIDQNGETWFNSKENELSLLGKSFKNVYVGKIPKDDIVGCNQIYYTSKEGVIGFADDKGDLWVLHEIK